MSLTTNGGVWKVTSNNCSVGPQAAILYTEDRYVDRNIWITGLGLDDDSDFYLKIPNGSENEITFHFSVDSDGNVTIDETEEV